MIRATGALWAVSLALIGLAAASVAVGSAPMDWPALIAGNALERDILLHLRLPRVLTAALTGAVLGLAGTALQTLLRNPLAAPDVIGFSAGASAGAAAAIILAGSLSLVWLGALTGGALGTALVLSLAWRSGLPGNSLILIGVTVGLMLTAATDVMLSFSPGIQAAETARFLTGGFAAADWPGVAWLTVAAAAGALVLGWQRFSIDRMDLGDDIALSQGLNVRRTRLVTLLATAGLVSASVSITGPLPFLSFLAGPIARVLTGQGGTVLAVSALTGAVLALGADMLARAGPQGMTLPAGLFTAALGGLSMIVILIRQTGRSR
ncbi:MAG: iron ABC transporter permease [Pseudomonadota bacterium]